MSLFYSPAQHESMELYQYVLMFQPKKGPILLIVLACSEWMTTSAEQ